MASEETHDLFIRLQAAMYRNIDIMHAFIQPIKSQKEKVKKMRESKDVMEGVSSFPSFHWLTPVASLPYPTTFPTLNKNPLQFSLRNNFQPPKGK